MSQWTLGDLAGHVFTFPAFTLESGFGVTVWTKVGANNAENLSWGRRAAIWNNTRYMAVLRDNNGAEVARYVY